MTTEEKIAQMYESQLKSQTQQLQKDHDTANANLDKVKQENKKTTDENLSRVAAESQKDMMNDAEYYAASGLSSGAKAQARIARETQRASDMAALRQAQQDADAETERQRALLAKEYTAAISKAQAENDLAKAKALYEQAQLDEERLLKQTLAQEETRQAEIKATYDAEQALLKNRIEGAKHQGDETGDYSLYYRLLGLEDSEIAEYNQNYDTGADGRPTRLTGHGLLTNTGNNEQVQVTTSSGKTGTTSVPVMKAEDGSLWRWDHMQHKYVPAKGNGTAAPRVPATETKNTAPGAPVTETENTTLFRNTVMSPREFANNRSVGKETSYNDYLLATLKKWYEGKRISDNELAWLINYYRV